ncbi:DUF2291 family protein [Kalamiella sp. sgz302252]|uniref:DUF2291 family protein n=1 Tax=Pantoea sp. sgz302252 TaxID=3341827 RepID=UPI0036D28EE1
MSRLFLLAVATLALAGCRIVSPQELADLKNPPNPQLANVGTSWQQKIVPQIAHDARPPAELMASLAAAKDFDSACQQFGYRSQPENPCVFAVRINGAVQTVDSASRSGKMTLKDRNGDIFTVQTGPVIRGTALRDGYKGASYQDFNDQVLFGDYGKAINQLAAAEVKKLQPKPGDEIQVEGVFSSWDVPQSLPPITPARVSRQ